VFTGEDGLRLSVLPTLDMLVERCGPCLLERLRWCPAIGGCVGVERCPGCDCEPEPAADESLRSVVLPLASVFDETRPSMCFTFCDFDRLCLDGVR
jgi:hypothetical protein